MINPRNAAEAGRVVSAVTIVDYDSRWSMMYEYEKAEILKAVGNIIVAIEHIGSTAVTGLAAKPIVDMMVAVHNLEDAKPCIQPLQTIGYEYLPELEAEIPERRFFRKAQRGVGTHHFTHGRNRKRFLGTAFALSRLSSGPPRGGPTVFSIKEGTCTKIWLRSRRLHRCQD